MALDFNNKIPEWKNKGTEPTDELKEKGFTGGYKPPATVFNWFWSLVQKCISELQTVVKSHADNTDNPHGVTKAQVGLGNVDNTADINKKVLSASKLTNAVKLNGITFDGTKDIEIPSTPKRTSLASDADLNEIIAQGEYFASYGNTCINKPNSVKGFALKVYWNIVGSTSAITQVLYPSIGAIPMCFIRKGNSNGWADWQEVSTVGHTHTQADITDFNKPTPLKLLEDATEIDLNDIKTTGIYTSVTQTNYLHCPTTLVTDSSSKPNYAFSLLVLGSRVYGSKDTISYYTQICIDNFGGQGQNQTWIRTYYGNAGWTIWYSIYSAKNKPTLEDITGSTVLPVSKGGTGFSAISAGYALVGNGTSAQLGTRYINSSVEEKSNDIVTGGAVYNALEKFNTLSKSSYVVAASDSDENLKRYADFLCTGENNGGNYILKIINEVPDNSTLYFLPGTYNISHIFLTVNKPITLTGAENGSTEFVLLGGACVRIGTEKEINNVCIKNITLKSERGEAYVGTSLIRIDDVNKLRIENVTLEEMIPSKVANVTAPATIIIKNSAKNMIVTGCRIKTNYSDFYNSYYAVDVQSETANSMIIGSTLVGSDGFRFNVKSKENTSYEQFGNLDFQLYIDGVKQTKEAE